MPRPSPCRTDPSRACHDLDACTALGCAHAQNAATLAHIEAQEAIRALAPAPAPEPEPLALTEDMLVNRTPDAAPAAAPNFPDPVLRPIGAELRIRAVRGGLLVTEHPPGQAELPRVVGVATGPAGVADLAGSWVEGAA